MKPITGFKLVARERPNTPAYTIESETGITVALETFEGFGLLLKAYKRKFDGGRAEIRLYTIEVVNGRPVQTYQSTFRRSETDGQLYPFTGEDF